ncbi:MAG: plastocyanin/azurin family copper-binding protein [Actinomycetota bacterium]
MRRTLLLVILTAMTLNSPAGATSAEEHRAVAGPGANVLGYLTPTITMTKGDSIVFTNLDAFEHSLVHDVAADGFGGKHNVPWCQTGAGHKHGGHSAPCPLFWSALVGSGGATQVAGLNRLKAGKTYSFICTKHHSMKGKLVVDP